MNKTAIKNFAVWARNKLRDDIILKAGLLGITDKGIAEPLKQSTEDLQIFDIGTSQPVRVEGETAIEQRKSLVAAIKAKQLTHVEAFNAVIEEVAYTWFNRLIAIRFMEVNDYLPSGVRVLSSENKAKLEPDFVTTPFDTDLDFTPAEQDRVIRLKDENRLDELFRMLFIKQCNKLHEILPELFEKTDDYTELLLTISFTDKDGIVYHLVHDIEEDDFNVKKEGQVEIIGWFYQYYNIEPKDKVFSRPSGQKIRKEDVPAATQLFTPDWIVRYMVENSLGRTVVHNIKYGDWNNSEKKKIDSFKTKWKYYIEEAEQIQETVERFRVEESHKYCKDDLPPFVDTTFLDPCMGSGHILVYAFDVFMDIYTAQGYTERDAVQSIVENNLYGLELDDRATQLAYFAVMMKARSYDRRFFSRGISPNVCSIQESNLINPDYLELFGSLRPTAQKLVDEFVNAKEYGSILKLSITSDEIAGLEEKYSEINNTEYDNIFDSIRQTGLRSLFAPLIKQAKILARQYDVVCTNPPYMGGSGMSPKLNAYVKKNYPDSKSDLFAVFIEKCLQLTSNCGYTAMITMHSWMFLSSFEKLREKMQLVTTVNMAHLGARAFDEISGEVVQTTAFVSANSHIKDYKGTYCRLIDATTENGKKNMFLSQQNRYVTSQENFSKIPGSPIAYWVSENLLSAFERGCSLGSIAYSKQGLATADNDRFVREWYEVSNSAICYEAHSIQESINSKCKWFPYNKGGEFRKWYGNNDYVVNWLNDGFEIRNFYGKDGRLRSRPQNTQYYFRPCFSWSLVSSSVAAFRYKPVGHLFDVAGMSCFSDNKDNLLYLLAICNSNYAMEILKIIAPTINYQCGDIANIPIIIDDEMKPQVVELTNQNISLSKIDWDSFETSWDFEVHPLVRWSRGLWDVTSISASMDYFYGCHPKVSCPLELCFMLWQGECNERFNKLKANEEELNRIFIDIYGLQDELTPEVEDKDVTVRKADLQRDIKSLISYAVGCMFGRYSLYKDGLIFAGEPYSLQAWFDKTQDKSKIISNEELLREYKTNGIAVNEMFYPDDDNCIPITDEEYFRDDDIVGRFVNFIETVYGEDTLEENLDFIARALGNKGNTSREVIRNYFLNDFIKDHIKTYQKRPIYWLFDSGKQNGFKALCYMHRWDADTIGNMRVEYLHRVQRVYEKELVRMQEIIDNSPDSKEISNATKRKEKLQKQLKETKDYDAKVAHLALSRIDIDLDDGVKVNYEKVQTAQDGRKLQILAKL